MARKPEPISARITASEKEDVLHRLSRKIARTNRKYAFEIKHGGTPEKKKMTKEQLDMLERERRSVERMQPLPGHVRRAEHYG